MKKTCWDLGVAAVQADTRGELVEDLATELTEVEKLIEAIDRGQQFGELPGSFSTVGSLKSTNQSSLQRCVGFRVGHSLR